jgi:hypothetical protein
MLAVHEIVFVFDSPTRYRPLPTRTASRISKRGVVVGGRRRYNATNLSHRVVTYSGYKSRYASMDV